MRRALLLALSLLTIPAVQAADLQPFNASYTADWKQLPSLFLVRLRSAEPLIGN
ncbi:hypothetical protein HKD51_10615, partial [Pseudomonas fragi]|nr:hypothetical protein [Pseudomonas sp. GC01]